MGTQESARVVYSRAISKILSIPSTRSLWVRFNSFRFVMSYVGAEFETKTLFVQEGDKVKLQIWDTAGQETFRSITKTFYRNCSAILLVYSMIR